MKNRIQKYDSFEQMAADRSFLDSVRLQDWNMARFYNDIVYQQCFNRYVSCKAENISARVKLSEELDAIAIRGLHLLDSQLNQPGGTA